MCESIASSHSSVQRLKTKLRLEARVINSAKEKLIELQENLDTEELVTEVEDAEEDSEEEVAEEEETADESENGVIVARNISLAAFLNYREAGIGLKMRLIDGKVIIIEAPFGRHSDVAGEVGKRMMFWHNDLISGGERDLIVDRNSSLRPDGNIQPSDLPPPPAGQSADNTGWPYPTVVVEVGVSEGLLSLHSCARRYFNQRTTIQLYIAIKIFGCRRDGTRVMVAFLYERTNHIPGTPVSVISFGTAPIHWSTLRFFRRKRVPNRNITGFGRQSPPCNALGIPDYQMNFSAAAIFHGSTGGIPANLTNGFNLDLYRVQRAALRY